MIAKRKQQMSDIEYAMLGLIGIIFVILLCNSIGNVLIVNGFAPQFESYGYIELSTLGFVFIVIVGWAIWSVYWSVYLAYSFLIEIGKIFYKGLKK